MLMAAAFAMFGSLGRTLARVAVVVGILALLFLPEDCAEASGSAPTVDAGPAKIIAFPQNDLTLFGHATDPENDPLTVTWTMLSGPASVSFSAPKALATTVTFTTTGVYTFQLVVNDGTSNVTRTVTVTVNAAASQTAFYVDPTYTGSTENGSASNPWKTASAISWTAINAALDTNDVVLYFSARTAESDVSESFTNQQLFISRTPRGQTTSTHRLTVDGMSVYNTNDASPNWVPYTGTKKFKLNGSGRSMGLGWEDDKQRDYVTIRGFEVTGSGSRIRWGGDYSYLEYMWVHDITTVGATVQFNQAVGENISGCPAFGRNRDITVRNNVIERGIGEGIYFAGNYFQVKYGGCPTYGNTHSDILIERNIVTDPGQNGGQGDGIDLKAGLQNVTVRNNLITNTHGGGNCILFEGVFPPAQANYLIEGNRCGGTEGGGVITLTGQNLTEIRNNILYGSPGSFGMYITEQDPGIYPNSNVRIYNNTLYNTRGIIIDHATNVSLRNNLLIGNNNSITGQVLTNYSSDYNLFAPSGSNLTEGTHSIVFTSTAGIVVNPASGDFHLTTTSRATASGIALSSFSEDFEHTFRPQGTAWDIGAYSFKSTAQPPTPPQNLQLQ